MAVEGIDVSTYQATTPSLTGRQFVFARASIGKYLDDRYAMHARNVRAAGKVLGAYHYVRDEIAASDQVATFLSAAVGADLLALDLEGADGGAAGRTVARTMIDRLHALGRQVGLYHSESGYPELGQDWRWVAHWGVAAPGIPWQFHQYRGSPLDLDRFHGDLAQLQAFVAGNKPGGTMAIYQRDERKGTAVLAAGQVAHGRRMGLTDWETVKSVTGPATWHFDHRLVELTKTASMDYALHAADGPLTGLYVNAGATVETYDPAAPVYGPVELAAAKSAGYADAKSKAIAAVQSI